jgi:hypothetical protein
MYFGFNLQQGGIAYRAIGLVTASQRGPLLCTPAHIGLIYSGWIPMRIRFKSQRPFLVFIASGLMLAGCHQAGDMILRCALPDELVLKMYNQEAIDVVFESDVILRLQPDKRWADQAPIGNSNGFVERPCSFCCGLTVKSAIHDSGPAGDLLLCVAQRPKNGGKSFNIHPPCADFKRRNLFGMYDVSFMPSVKPFPGGVNLPLKFWTSPEKVSINSQIDDVLHTFTLGRGLIDITVATRPTLAGLS